MLIVFCQIIDSHSGELIAEQVVGLIQKYDIEKKLRYFVFNNATSNNTYVKAIFKAIWPVFFKKKHKLWYVGHIINFITQTFLYGKNKEVFTIKVQGTRFLVDIKK